jgi:hypothetical protein
MQIRLNFATYQELDQSNSVRDILSEIFNMSNTLGIKFVVNPGINRLLERAHRPINSKRISTIW